MVVGADARHVYKKQLDSAANLCMKDLLISCNNATHLAYSKLSKDVSVNTTMMRTEAHLNTYYGNMVIRAAKDVLKSNNELSKTYQSDTKDEIKELESKVKERKESLSKWNDYRTICKSLNVNNYKNGDTIKCEFPYQIIKDDDKILVFRINDKEKTKVSLYEHICYLDTKISRLRHTIWKNQSKIEKLKNKLKKLETKGFRSCFGTKKLLRAGSGELCEQEHREWKEEWTYSRHNNFTISGAAGYEQGSMCVRYDVERQVLKIMDIRDYKRADKTKTVIDENGNKTKVLVPSKYYDHKWFEIPCEFVYRKELYLDNIKANKTTAYQIVDKGDYYLIKAIFEIDNDNRLLESVETGVVALDINVDCFALVNLDQNGNFLNRKVIDFDLRNLSSNQSQKVIEAAAIEVLEFCRTYKKPLVIEDLKDIKFKNTGDCKRNKTLTQFAYNKMITTLERTLYKNGYKVYKIDPAYTSQQGKLKYMRRFGMSIHESAAFCIGRKFLFSRRNKDGKITKYYYEKLDKYRKFGAKTKYATIKKVSTPMKKLRVRDFYELHKLNAKIENYKTLQKYVNDVKVELEQMKNNKNKSN